MKLIFLIVGLGNPGAEYVLTRHNIGFLAVDATVREYNCASYQDKFHGLTTRTSYTLPSGNVCDIVFLKPTTFMNVSGRAVQAAMQFYKIPLSRVLVIHDDLDLDPGQVKLKIGGGHGGHNGLKSLDQCVGKDYLRLRLGIGHPGHKDLVTPHVLGAFKKTDQRWLEPVLWSLGRLIPHLCESMRDVPVKNASTSQKPGALTRAHSDWLNAYHTLYREEEARMG